MAFTNKRNKIWAGERAILEPLSASLKGEMMVQVCVWGWKGLGVELGGGWQLAWLVVLCILDQKPSGVPSCPCCTVVYCFVLRCAVLFCGMLSRVVLYCVVLCCVVLCCVVLCCVVLCCVVLCCVVLCCVVLCCVVLCCVVLCCVVLCCVASSLRCCVGLRRCPHFGPIPIAGVCRRPPSGPPLHGNAAPTHEDGGHGVQAPVHR